MASIYDLKPRFQELLRPLVKLLANAGVTANQVTVAALILSVIAGLAIGYFPHQRLILFVIPVVLFVRMALNAIDGMLAREFNMKTRLGAVLNELGDVLADSALYLPLAWVPGFYPPWLVAIVLLAVISEMTGVIGIQIGASRRYDGPMGKSDRAFVFGLIALLLGMGIPAGLWLDIVLILMVLLIGTTIVNRARQALREKP